MSPIRASDRRRPQRRAAFALALALAPLPALAQGTRALPSPEARLILLAGHERSELAPPEDPVSEGLQGRYDVLHYDLSVLLDPSKVLIDGTVSITLRSLVPSLDQVELDLHYPEYVVRWAERVDRPGTTVEVRRDGDKLRLLLWGDTPGSNDECVLAINYVGRPRNLPARSPAVTFEESVLDGSPRIHSFTEPNLSRGWWPCKDRPDDKATIELHLEAPENVTVVANGVLRETRPGRDGFLVTTWTHDYPVATYLVAFSAARFARWTEPWIWRDDMGVEHVMNVYYWAWPELAEWAYQDFSTTRSMMDALGERFGTYPFKLEKYGIMVFGEDGGMEHQTATSMGGSVIALSRGSGAIDNVLVHELAHQWWGDDVGIDSFASMWLKEGLATWSEALWWEEDGGLASYLEYMEDLSRPIGGTEFEGTLDAPEDIFGQAVYFKGAWLIHMLRWVLSGPSLDGHAEPVLQLLRDWGASRSGGTASTADFVDFVSRATPIDGSMGDESLADWFFPQWLRREDRPRYAIDVASHPDPSGNGWTSDLRIEQRQGGEPYKMPIHVRLLLEDGSRTDRIRFVDEQVTDTAWWTEQRVVGAELDPDGWILKAAVGETEIDRDDDGWADWRDGCPDVPDPLQRDENGNGLPDACEPGLDFDGDGLLNEEDCAPGDAEAWRAPARDAILRVENSRAGLRLRFDLPDPYGQRPYVLDVAIGTLLSLRADGSMASAGCLANDHEAETLESALSFGSLGTYWVAVPHNGCPTSESAPTRRNPCP